jgi:hypothetical protein
MSALDFSILWPALIAGLLVTATHVPLGTQVLARGIVFIDIAIAQIAGCGVLIADRLGFPGAGLAVQVAAFIAALAGALLLTWTERVWPDVQEAVIGVTFVLGATGSIMLLASNPHGSEHLQDLLVGQILWAQASQLVAAAVLYAIVLAAWFGARVLRALRALGHGVGAAGRPLPRLRHPHRAAARDAPHGTRAARRGLGDRGGGIRRGAGRLDRVRPAERGRDRLDPRRGGARVVRRHGRRRRGWHEGAGGEQGLKARLSG